MGVMGNAPSHELMEEINKREADLQARGGMVLLPDTADAVPRGTRDSRQGSAHCCPP